MHLAEQECQRYYQPWLAAHGSPAAVAEHLSSVTQLDLQRQGWEPLPSRDQTLIAFAQNVVLRLGVRRCMISLIDASHQYVLAEATRSYSRTHPNGKPGDEIWMGSAALRRTDGICEHVLLECCHACNPLEDKHRHAAGGLVVNDCRRDSRFSEKSFVAQTVGPRVCFYAGVPLLSRSGVNIGVLCATDENPRNGLPADELRYMQDMAQCAMDHLEWARDRIDRYKGERVVRGMASFIEGTSTLRDTSLALTRSSSITKISSGPTQSRADSPQRHTHSQRRNPEPGVADAHKSRLLSSAATILRDCTNADGCVIFGAQAASDLDLNSSRSETGTATEVEGSKMSPMARPCKPLSISLSDAPCPSSADLQRGSPITLGTLQQYFTSFPHGHAFSFNEDDPVNSPDVRSRSQGAAYEVPQTSETCAEAMSTADEEHHSQDRQMNHKELLQYLPGKKTIIFSPLFDPADDRLLAGVFLWSSTAGRMADTDLPHIQAFSNCIVSEMMRLELQRNEAAKTTFIESISHELRSPLHGILGAAEFLFETTTNAYDGALVTSIITCGKTLLDTLNHLLDHSKINKLGSLQNSKKPEKDIASAGAHTYLESMTLTVDIDLSALVEEAAEAVTAGHTFKRISNTAFATSSDSSLPGISRSFDSLASALQSAGPPSAQGVAILLDITPRHNWMVTVPPGAIQRVIMNLMGNALKYTSAGFVALSLRALDPSVDDDKVSVLIRVVDSGKGISENFQKEKLFVPFSQEDSFQAGTGLGLSIVKQIVNSLGGSIQVFSSKGSGTQVDVYLDLPSAKYDARNLHTDATDSVPNGDSATAFRIHDYPLTMLPRMAGKRLVLLDPLETSKTRTSMHQATRFQQTLRETCEKWFGMHVSCCTTMDDAEDVSMFLYGEPPSIEMLRQHERNTRHRSVPVILACQSDHDAIAVIRGHQKTLRELGGIVEVIQQPCGPRKLAKTFAYCLNRVENNGEPSSIDHFALPEKHEQKTAASSSIASVSKGLGKSRSKPKTSRPKWRKTVSVALAMPSTPSIDPKSPAMRSEIGSDTSSDLLRSQQPSLQATNDAESAAPRPSEGNGSRKEKHLLLVDDNKINRQLLVMFAKKCGYTSEEAENGQEAVESFSSSHKNPSVFPTASNSAEGGKCHVSSTSPATNPPRAKFDVILMDISMPVMDGMEATERIRQMEHARGLPRTKIFALTGLASGSVREQAETVGFDVFLPKPVKFAQLKRLIS